MTMVDRERVGRRLERVAMDRTDFCNSTFQLGEGIRLLANSGANEALEKFEKHLADEQGFGDVKVQFPEPYEGVTKVDVHWNFREVIVGNSRFKACSSLIVYARTRIDDDLMIIGHSDHDVTLSAKGLGQEEIYNALLRVSKKPIIHLLGRATGK